MRRSEAENMTSKPYIGEKFMRQKPSQQNLWEHSEAKIKLLQLYLEQYVNILNQTPFIKEVNIFDLFCGEGFYPNGGNGSPIIILEVLRQLHPSSNSTKFDLLFNDSDQEKILKLKSVIKERYPKLSPLISSLKYEQKDFRKIFPDIKRKVSGVKSESRAFIFLDPYGYSDVKISDLEELLSSRRNEVLLFLPTQFMFRFEKRGRPRSLHKFIEELIPENQWPNSHTGINFIENLTNAFMKKFGDRHFVDSFIITRDANQFFCLFFFTGHLYGFDRMLHAKWRLDEKEGLGWSPHITPTLFDPIKISPKLEQFKEDLIKYIYERPRNNLELYLFTLVANRHLPKHTNQILADLQTKGRIQVTKNDGTIAKKKAFFISYKYYKENKSKIVVKRN